MKFNFVELTLIYELFTLITRCRIDNKPYTPRQLSHINDNCVERNKNYPTVNTLIYKSLTIFATFQFPLCRYASSVPSGTCKVIPVLLKMGGTTCGT